MPDPRPAAESHIDDPVALDALEAVEAALDALDDRLVSLYMRAADGDEVSDEAAALAETAERIAAVARTLVDILTPPPPITYSPNALLDQAQAALDAAIAELHGALEDPHPAGARALTFAAARVESAARTLVAASRTVAVWSVDLKTLAPPAGFETPAVDAATIAPAVDRITTMVLDPDQAFVAWSVTAAGHARARRALLADDPPVLTLRIYLEGAGRTPEVIDHPMDDWVGQTTMSIADRANTVLVCAIGLAAGSVFAHIARAEAVRLPGPPADDAPRFSRVVIDEDGRPQLEEKAPEMTLEDAPRIDLLRFAPPEVAR